MNIKKQQKNSTNIRGFTIIETVVAIFVLLASVTGPLTFGQSGLRASFFARDQITAFYLAQDAIETLKNLRDDAGIEGKGWLYYFDLGNSNYGCTPAPTPGETKVCNFDVNPADLIVPDTSCNSGVCKPLNYDSLEHRFTVDGTREGKYTRTVFVTEVNRDKEVQIVVKVSWNSNFFGTKEIIVQENIYNWISN